MLGTKRLSNEKTRFCASLEPKDFSFVLEKTCSFYMLIEMRKVMISLRILSGFEKSIFSKMPLE